MSTSSASITNNGFTVSVSSENGSIIVNGTSIFSLGHSQNGQIILSGYSNTPLMEIKNFLDVKTDGFKVSFNRGKSWIYVKTRGITNVQDLRCSDTQT